MSTDGLMINDLGDRIALFMLFNPLTNIHYLMFQMGQGDGILANAGSFDIASMNVGDTIGTSVMMAGGGSINLNTYLVVNESGEYLFHVLVNICQNCKILT